MKRVLLYTSIFLLMPLVLSGQTNQGLTDKCRISAGPNTTYLKDHVIKLPKTASKTDMPVVKENMFLSKGIKYRFTICNADGSAGELYVSVYEKDRKVISSYDEKSGKIYNSIDFVCNKTGMYTLWYSFRNGEPGMGIGVISLVRQ